MTRKELFQELRRRNQPVPKPLSLPTAEDVAAIERRLDIRLPEDFKDYLLQVSDVICGTIEPVNASNPAYYTYIDTVYEDLMELKEYVNIPADVVPLCQDNGDFYCMEPTGRIIYITHDGIYDKTWASLDQWIEEVWLQS